MRITNKCNTQKGTVFMCARSGKTVDGHRLWALCVCKYIRALWKGKGVVGSHGQWVRVWHYCWRSVGPPRLYSYAEFSAVEEWRTLRFWGRKPSWTRKDFLQNPDVGMAMLYFGYLLVIPITAWGTHNKTTVLTKTNKYMTKILLTTATARAVKTPEWLFVEGGSYADLPCVVRLTPKHTMFRPVIQSHFKQPANKGLCCR